MTMVGIQFAIQHFDRRNADDVIDFVVRCSRGLTYITRIIILYVRSEDVILYEHISYNYIMIIRHSGVTDLLPTYQLPLPSLYYQYLRNYIVMMSIMIELLCGWHIFI